MAGRFKVEQRILLGEIEIGRVRLGLWHADFFARGHVQDFAAEALVAEQGADILETGKAPVTILIPERRCTDRVQLLIEAIGVLHEPRGLWVGADTRSFGDVGIGGKLNDGGHAEG